MNAWKPGVSLLGLVLCASLGLSGCDNGFAVHSIIEDPDADAAARSDLYGLWVHNAPGEGEYWAMRIAPPSLRSRMCETAEVVVWDEPRPLDQPPMSEGRVCLTEVAGLTVAELVTPGEPALFRHYLVRLEPTRVSVCGLSLWATFKGPQDTQDTLFSLDGLDYTVRSQGESHDVFVISPRDTLRAYLEKNLPRLASICSEEKTDDDQRPSWLVFERVAPLPAATPEGPEK